MSSGWLKKPKEDKFYGCDHYLKRQNFRLNIAESIADDKLTHYQMTNFRLFQTERVCKG